MAILFKGFAAAIVIVVAVALAAVLAVFLRPASSPPLSAKVPDLAFMLPGVERLVKWEADLDARRAFRDGRELLLGYNHGRDVGSFSECEIDGYEDGAGQRENLPPWVDRASIGTITLECAGSGKATAFNFTVLECGNPFDVYQVVYGRAFNEEMLRLARLSGEGDSTAQNSR